jgi:hypothetical protein
MATATGYTVWFLSIIPALWIDVAMLEEEVSTSQIKCLLICPILHTRAHHVQNFEHNNEVPMRP